MDEYLASRRAKESSIDRAEKGAGDDWVSAAVHAIEVVSRNYRLLSSDTVRKQGGVGDPPEPRAWGAAFRKAASLGLIVATKEYHTPTRLSSHRRPMRLWKSLHLNFCAETK